MQAFKRRVREQSHSKAPTSTASHPCTQKRVGAEASGEGIPSLLTRKELKNS